MRLKTGLTFLGAVCGIFSLGALVAPPWAGATNIDVSVSSACVGTTWLVTLNAHNTHDGPLRIVNDNSVENWTATLAPGEARSARINPPDATFHYVWSSPDGHLVGTTTATLARPTGCTPATTTPTTEVMPSLPTSPPSSTPTTSIPASPSLPTASTATSTAISPSPSTPLRTSSPTSTPRPSVSGSLPTTGPPDWPAVVAVGLATAIVGACLVLCARRRGV